MKRIIYVFAVYIIAVCASSFMHQSDKPLTKQSDGTYIINTTTLAQDVKGYQSPTPLKIYIKKDKIQKIEALANKETPKFFKKVSDGILEKWNGKSVKAAQTLKVDAITGATLSSNAVKENVKRGLAYYVKNK